MKPGGKKMLMIGVLLLVLAASGVYLLINTDPNDASPGAPQQQSAPAAIEDQNTPGTIAPSATGQGQFAGLEASDAVTQLEEWLRLASGTGGPLNQDLIRAMMRSLQKNAGENRALYLRLRHLLEDDSIDVGRKQEFIAALDRAANPLAVQMLAELARQNLPPVLKQMIINALSNVGEYYWDSASLAEAVLTIKALWLQSQDPELLGSMASALVKAGDATSIGLLFESLLSESKTVSNIEHSRDPRVSAAWKALNSLLKPEAVPVLQDILQSSTNGLEVSIAANLLAGMGSVEAVSALLSWAQRADDASASIVREAFARIGTYDSLQYLNSFLAQNPSFKSKQVQSAITSVLKK